jgi:transcriptional regulator with XRE-family HTH domain
MSESRRSRGSALTPEQREKIQAIREQSRTAEARERETEVRAHYADRPNLSELIRRGEVDPARMTTMGALAALHKALATARRAREAKGLSLSDVARRAKMPLPSLSRLESGKNPNFTFETLARYAAAVGLDLEIRVLDREEPAQDGGQPTTVISSAGDLTDVVNSLSMDVLRLSEIVKGQSAGSGSS